MKVKFRYSETNKEHEVITTVGEWYILQSSPTNWSSDCHVAVRKEVVDVIEEVTFHIGQRFSVGGSLAILAQIQGFKVALIDLTSGNRFKDPIEVNSIYKITWSELNSLSNSPIILKG